MRYFFRLTVSIAASLLLSHTAQAHLFAPSLLKVSEVSTQSYNVVWKTPVKTASNIPLRPIWPEGCETQAESTPRTEGTGIVSSWELLCDQSDTQGLIGQVLGISGLAANQVSAMVMLSLRDEQGQTQHYQAVLKAEDPEYQVPAEPGLGEVTLEYSVLGLEHIWGGIDHLMFVFGLLLLVGGGGRLFWTITAFTVGHSITPVSYTHLTLPTTPYV